MLNRLGFNMQWRLWIKEIVSNSNISILVSRGLKQIDPLAPFLFLIVAQGLAGLVHNAVEKGIFKGVNLDSDCNFPIIQYADDSVLMGEASFHNFWAIKTIFRGFELYHYQSTSTSVSSTESTQIMLLMRQKLTFCIVKFNHHLSTSLAYRLEKARSYPRHGNRS